MTRQSAVRFGVSCSDLFLVKSDRVVVFHDDTIPSTKPAGVVRPTRSDPIFASCEQTPPREEEQRVRRGGSLPLGV